MQTKQTIQARAWSGRVLIEAKETRTYLSFDEAIDLLNDIDHALAEASMHDGNDQ